MRDLGAGRDAPARRPAAYLQLSEAYENEAAKARKLGWPVAEQPSHHLVLLTGPGRIAARLCELLGQLR